MIKLFKIEIETQGYMVWSLSATNATSQIIYSTCYVWAFLDLVHSILKVLLQTLKCSEHSEVHQYRNMWVVVCRWRGGGGGIQLFLCWAQNRGLIKYIQSKKSSLLVLRCTNFYCTSCWMMQMVESWSQYWETFSMILQPETVRLRLHRIEIHGFQHI